MAASSYLQSLKYVLVHEGGNDDDPADPGGRTSRGITAGDWNEWRKTHPGLPSDVWQAPQDQVEAIYRQRYWDALHCNELSIGVDYCVFDYGINSGISRSAGILQKCLGVAQDGKIGPITLAAAGKADAGKLINQICDERLDFLKHLSTWGRFGRGWATRVSDVRKNALAMAQSGPPKPVLVPQAAPTPTASPEAPHTPSLADRLVDALGGLFHHDKPPPVEPPKPVPPPDAPELHDLGHRIKRTMLAMKDDQGKPYPWFDDQNVVSVEGMDPSGKPNNNRTNAFDDIKMILSGAGEIIGGPWCATTMSGAYWTKHRMDPRGAFDIDLGPQSIWTPGDYHGNIVWRQAEDSNIRGFRDDAEDFSRRGEPQLYGNIGVHHHGGGDQAHDDIGRRAAGCQVIENTADQAAFMRITLACPRYLNDKKGYRLTATVLRAKDILS